MKSITKKSVLAVALATCILAGSYAQGQMGRRGFGPGQNHQHQNFNKERMGKYIPDLADEQMEQLKELRIAHFKKMKDFRNQMGEIEAQMKTIMSANDIDVKKAEGVIDKQTELMNNKLKATIAYKAGVKDVLTEEQLLAIDLAKERRSKFAHRRKGQGNRGQFRQHQRQGSGGNW